MVILSERGTQPATRKQTWAIFCMTKYDVRDCGLTIQLASEMIDKLKKGEPVNMPENARSVGGKMKEKSGTDKKDFAMIWREACNEGRRAVEKCRPVPMVVVQHKNQLDDNSPVEQKWVIEDGVCGFAWVNITPGTSAFAKWLKANAKGYKDYYGGISVSCHEYNQSMTKKEEWCHGVCSVLKKYGIEASTRSRMD